MKDSFATASKKHTAAFIKCTPNIFGKSRSKGSADRRVAGNRLQATVVKIQVDALPARLLDVRVCIGDVSPSNLEHLQSAVRSGAQAIQVSLTSCRPCYNA